MKSPELDATLQAVSYPYPMDRKRKKLRVAIVTGTLPRLTQKTSSPRLMVSRVRSRGFLSTCMLKATRRWCSALTRD